MKKILFINGIESYEKTLNENGIMIYCNDNMEMEISEQDAQKLMNVLEWNKEDIIIE